jgi:hypothetical protein
MAIVIATLSGFALLWALVWILIPERPQGGAAPAGPAKSDTDNRRALDAAALLLEVGIWALVMTAGDKLRRRCIIWRLLPRMRLWGINHL